MTDDTVENSDDEWRQELTDEQFRIMREKGTEAPYSGKYHDSKEHGVYKCVACGAELFSSETKFDSGSGWPSFYQAVNDEAVTIQDDSSLGMKRTEVLCTKCGGHLGHLFDDGPEPAGQRFCINSAALALEPKRDRGNFK